MARAADAKSAAVDPMGPLLRRQDLRNALLRSQDAVMSALRRIMFQQYPQSDVNEAILLHEGRFRVRQSDRCVEGSGSARLRWLPSPGIEFDIEIAEPFLV